MRFATSHHLRAGISCGAVASFPSALVPAARLTGASSQSPWGFSASKLRDRRLPSRRNAKAKRAALNRRVKIERDRRALLGVGVLSFLGRTSALRALRLLAMIRSCWRRCQTGVDFGVAKSGTYFGYDSADASMPAKNPCERRHIAGHVELGSAAGRRRCVGHSPPLFVAVASRTWRAPTDPPG